MLFHSIRIAANFDRALVNDRSSAEEISRRYSISSAQEIISLIRIYRLKHGLQYSSLVLVYATAQACRAVRAFGIAEEYESLIGLLRESASTWTLANEVLITV